MPRRRKRNALPKVTMRVPRKSDEDREPKYVPVVPARSKEDAKTRGMAWWTKGDLVEINIHNVPNHQPEHDPNKYMAICITSGTFPKLRVVDENNDQHPDFELLVEGQYSIWGVL